MSESRSSSTGDVVVDCEICGWIAALISMITFGTFGVPIKSNAAKRCNIDPLVFQSYKTFMCFITSWFILLYGEPFQYTPWGIVSGLFWVPGGVATVYGVKNAGLAIAIGTLSSCIVLVSFAWGFFVFHEHVHSYSESAFAILCMVSGLFGMSYYSSHESSSSSTAEASYQPVTQHEEDQEDDNDEECKHELELSSSGNIQNNSKLGNDTVTTTTTTTTTDSNHVITSITQPTSVLDDNNSNGHGSNNNCTEIGNCQKTEEPFNGSRHDDKILQRTKQGGIPKQQQQQQQQPHKEELHDTEIQSATFHHYQNPLEQQSNYIVVCGKKVKRRHAGIASAIFSGTYGGSIMAPMKLCQDPSIKGKGYLISFAIGASIITILIWILRYVYNVMYFYKHRTSLHNSTNHVHQSSILSTRDILIEAYMTLPSFHIHTMFFPGITAGLLWSIGNFCSMISVQYLGQGIGYSVVQTSMLVSGLWGIFYFREVTGYYFISRWFLSAFITLCGILILSYEHHEG